VKALAETSGVTKWRAAWKAARHRAARPCSAVDAATFLATPHLQEEVFGAASLVVLRRPGPADR
jgi:alpha-ketoglutaric semialdehyde dehydrogenase